MKISIPGRFRKYPRRNAFTTKLRADSRLLPALLPSDGSTVAMFERWLSTAKEGQVLVYHRGALAPPTNLNGDALREAARLNLVRVAHCLWVAAQQGRVHLLQRRLGEDCFEYLAVARQQSIAPSSHSYGGNETGLFSEQQ
jgi:hypothetical protein